MMASYIVFITLMVLFFTHSRSGSVNSKRRCSRLHECNVPVFIHISMKCFIPLFVCIVFMSSSSVARHVPSRFRVVVGFQRARLFSRRRRRGRRRRTTTAGAAVFTKRERKIHRRRKKRENDRFPVDRARWFPRAHRVSSFLKSHVLYIQASKV